MKIYVLLRQFEHRPDYDHEPPEVRVMGAYRTPEDLQARVDRIAKGNAQYPLQTLVGGQRWRIGPTEDEGFFGNRPVEMWAVETTLEIGSR